MSGWRERLYGAYRTTHEAARGPAAAAEALDYDFDRNLRGLLPADRNARVLDAGCGGGAFLRFLAARGYTELSGVDLSDEQLAEAARACPQAKLEKSDGAAFLKRHPGAFALVCAFDVLEHVPRESVLDWLDAAREALAPGGLLVLRTVNGAAPFSGCILHGDFTHEQAFTTTSLSQLFRAAGLSAIEFRDALPYALWRGPRGWLRRAAAVAARSRAVLYYDAMTGSGLRGRGQVWSEELIAAARKADG